MCKEDINDIEDEKKKDIEIVTGDGKDLDISPVYNHIKIDKPDTGDKDEEIVVPKEKRS